MFVARQSLDANTVLMASHVVSQNITHETYESYVIRTCVYGCTWNHSNLIISCAMISHGTSDKTRSTRSRSLSTHCKLHASPRLKLLSISNQPFSPFDTLILSLHGNTSCIQNVVCNFCDILLSKRFKFNCTRILL